MKRAAPRLAVLLTLLSAAGARADVPVGIEASIEADLPAGVRAADVTPQSPAAVRIGDVQITPAAGLYTLHYQLFEPGPHDLRSCLLTADGKPLASATPIVVTARSALPKDDSGAIESVAPLLPAYGGYPIVRSVAVAGWTGLGLAALLWPLRKRRHTPIKTPPAPATEQTDDERLASLAAAVRNNHIDTPDKLRLELLLLARWRRQNAAGALTLPEAMPVLRQDAAVGPLLATLDRALHVASPRLNQAALLDLLDQTQVDSPVALGDAV